ncbi:TIR domain-containing protein [candidate division KSB1 bacterium]|nr:TIR domain-containing protein [candidate division KSB1 bacterium]NIR68541.1 TIR domain-containing protein [candidate division KSB1 bacterium]NIS27107.1 TIR domain-containing protein [candidate division KSB1 bacterium]NIT73992.1 TIR domain-containing protein [candidate division KSB1 bacterium]NIU27851.1 TIR domain-containing protein [candidate division KSB1 bacterium]
MSKIFVSYARQDIDLAEQLEQTLKEHGCRIWRDEQNVYAGQNWPKAIGEAIEAHDVLLLLWSRHAKNAHFVEFEWSTALALRKPILPCLLDDTPLPPSLSAINGLPVRDLETEFPKIFQSLPKAVSEADPERREKVLNKLSDLKRASPKKATDAVQKLIHQKASDVRGDVMQAGRDIHITKPDKSWYEQWYYLIALLAALLTIAKFAIDFVDNTKQAETQAGEIVEEQTLEGTVWDEDVEPLPGVIVFLSDYKMTDTTDTNGVYKFKVTNKPKEALVELVARKDGFQTQERGATLGNTSNDFTLRRKP